MELLASIKKELGSGLSPSEPDRAPFLWADGRNIVFSAGRVQSAFGQFLLFITGQQYEVTGVRQTFIGGKQTVFFGTPTKLFRWNATDGVVDLTPASPYTGTAMDVWVFARWGDWMVATNGVDPVQIWKGTGTFAALSGPGFTWAKLIWANDTHLFAGNTSDGSSVVAWADLDDPEDWTAVPANDAGELTMRNLDSEIKAVAELGNSFAIYTTNEMYILGYIGRPYVYGIRPTGLKGFGPLGPNAVSNFNGRHFGIGTSSIWVTDGNSVEFIQAPALTDFLYKEPETKLDINLGWISCSYNDAAQTQIVFYYATAAGAGVNDIGVGFNYKDNVWTIFSEGRSAACDASVFPFPITATSSGNIYQQSVADAPPAAGSSGICNLDSVSYEIVAGVGEAGIGDFGLGGFVNGAG